MELKQFAGQNMEELSMLEVAHAILETKGDVIDFTELLIAIQEYLGLSEEQVESRMAQFYTDMNIDGRFISLGENRWGLRAWYPIDSIDEEIISSAEEEAPIRPRKKRKYNAFGDDEDMIDYNDDDPEDMDISYDEDDIIYDEEDDEDESDDLVGLSIVEDDDEENEELTEYASDLSEFGDADLDEDIEIVDEEDDSDDFEEEEEVETELIEEEE
ncbi:DNA-directed RNA polymerase subunit delta [Aerococcaceae bacterium NML210727]|nr:DNA-directed RNA polymerase subunit delta [Aerococcaceae bacterium NML210727]MCW6654567.1 DNA-directed RNA polymerase subunit delta [Aerococcaceae bacterium NML201296]MCW6661240.1 DNA-directed RNA polymerase subunit delta [Aerococcaceae bacterium NML201209]MCW6662518.1 DNA-directed RNA polymerase subunit delta [Aerococcaceae bacterium NML190073]MCW6664569.1 DNA-directed RNA polymerase subunit delta [Aerococcaceae bacterium NML191219]MCW6665998.1 DNA-directed RNA polymerase subunit delta [Ae